MKIGIASDHGGFTLKEDMAKYVRDAGHEVVDYGAYQYDAQDDFPDFIIPLSQAVGRGEVERGIAICGSGVGACIAANKVKNVRAALLTETYSARQGVEHDDMNMICLGGRVIGIELTKAIIDAFLDASYSGKDRHRRRMDKVAALESDWE